MNEDFISFLWSQRLYTSPLYTTDGNSIEVYSPGFLNHDAGPDFFNAKIKIDSVTWVGNVEIHVNATDWFKHKHHLDEAYNNTILHICFLCDGQAVSKAGLEIPQVELKTFCIQSSMDIYNTMMQNVKWIPCENMLSRVEDIKVFKCFESCLVERLIQKAQSVTLLLNNYNHDWMQVFFICLARAFGFRVNAMPFELLAQSTPINLILKNADNLHTLEALLFGQAGMLSEQHHDPYPVALYQEYQYLKHKYNLKTVPYSVWKFMRIRPTGFPTIRISQLAAFFHVNHTILPDLINGASYSSLTEALQISASQYWNTHHKFDVKAPLNVKNMGKDSVMSIIINAFIPYLFSYQRNTNAEFQHQVTDLLFSMPPENNKVVRYWNTIGPKITSAAQSQALLQLKSNYCDQKQCLNCLIGHAILSSRT